MRAVAREAGLSMGSVRYFFSTHEELLRFAVLEVVDQARRRIDAGMQSRMSAVEGGRPLVAVTALLEEVLPLDDERLTEARVWAAFTAPPLTDPKMAAMQRHADDAVKRLCQSALAGLTELGLLHPARDFKIETERLHALLDGMTIRLLLAPRRPPGRTRSVLLTHLNDLLTAPDPRTDHRSIQSKNLLDNAGTLPP